MISKKSLIFWREWMAPLRFFFRMLLLTTDLVDREVNHFEYAFLGGRKGE